MFVLGWFLSPEGGVFFFFLFFFFFGQRELACVCMHPAVHTSKATLARPLIISVGKIFGRSHGQNERGAYNCMFPLVKSSNCQNYQLWPRSKPPSLQCEIKIWQIKSRQHF